MTKTNMPEGVFRSDRVPGDRWGTVVRNAVLLSGHVTAGEAMDACNAARRADRSNAHRYWVASAAYPVEETYETVAA